MKFFNSFRKRQFAIFIPLFFIFFVSYTTVPRPKYVAVPDASFERALIFLGIDSDGIINGLIKADDIKNVNYLDLSNQDIVDITGIEQFVSLKYLDISKNNIQRLNLCSLKKLEDLNCSSNALLFLDVCKKAKFKKFNFMNNPDAMKISWN